ncbi:junctophilin-1 isoform X1 [Neodiprion virginianus]|uniref:junctophilin-1 isoform X1 n=1 Tax=Neodiprion virginianus TaxID=2961670 RepID=UPI001EE706F3|nr:junctophilin-1 isoform X1 [Neodiprion virginianus]XP_046622215.1 junctophilin-1 isoform X1 [Neodiprion virginianus]XP_046622216.1 junctophilin-1 isoform X1 [Neodiprion virginianus]XP_046622218.1 junctophilin-1 isoform X1 [Neodiprion virginianus]XP_046622219.1 junctophilin-1 isoform X1 [Neodiprion virginianus]XP_046622220.1 junctophilin-1 isoform X1 [Neodiprion virginianus]XP_046622221.1 junctophilin-1 isoform X1 [Neodiprion virginianus]
MQQPQGATASGAPNGVAGGAQIPPAGGLSPVQPGTTASNSTGQNRAQVNGGRFDFDDGGTYCGGWEDGKAHGHGVCTGPKGQGAYSGSWHYGFEVSGVYTWPSGSAYEGQWQNGKRHGLGMETRGRWLYRGEWTQGFKGRYGVRQSTTSTARYEGTWASGLHDGYGSETYADSGTYQGQWLRGMRHGYGVRASAPFGLASHYKPPKQVRASLTSLRSADGGPAPPAPTPEPTDRRDRRVDDSRGGFVLKARSDDPPARRKSLTEKSGLKKGLLSGLKIRKQRSTGDLEKRGTGGSIRSNASSASWMSTESSQSQASASVHTDSNASFVIEDEQMDASVTETYLGEWKNDRRTGFGISERSDGLRYEGEWFNNRKYGYGVTTFRDGSKEEGKYKNNVLITSQKKKHLFLIRSAKFRERIEAAVNAAQRASKIALQKADIAISRTATARGKAELADIAAEHAREDSDIAQHTARQFAPDFRQPGLERLRNREIPKYVPPPQDAAPAKSILLKSSGAQDQAQIQGPSSPGETTASPSAPSQSLTQSITQSMRRASMRPAQSLSQNQNPVGSTQNQQNQNQYTAQSQNQYTNPPSNNPYNQTQPNINQMQNQFQQQYVAQNSYGLGGQSQFGAQNNGGTPTQFGQSQAQNQEQTEQYQAYQTAQGYQNQYQNQQGYPNQQMLISPFTTSIGPMTQLPQMNQFYGEQLYRNAVPNQYAPTPLNNQVNQTNQMSQMNQMQNQINSQAQNQYMPNYVQQPQQQQQQQQPQQQQYQNDPTGVLQDQQRGINTGASIRRNSRILSPQDRPPGPPMAQAFSDRLDHYKRPPSRDSSVDRYARAHSRLTGSRQPSIDKGQVPQSQESIDRSARGASTFRSATPLNGSAIGSGAATPVYTVPTSSQFEGALLRNRGLGQDILPSPGQPKRTESLYVSPARGGSISAIGGGGAGGGGGGGGGGGPKAMPVTAMPLQRKKSLPDVAQPIQLTASSPLSREEVSVLSSARREEIRRQIDEGERLRANPLLYLVSPQVKDWFSRQQLVMLVLFINISLALMFFKLLT